MPSKFDLIRQGHAVEIEPGLSGKLNKEKKTLELSSGEVLNVGHNKNFFPSNEQDVKLSKQREYAEKSAKGGGGEFFHQYTSEGIPGSISDIGAYLTQSGDEYATRKQAQNQVSERISEESPYISGAATGANIATDIVLTRGMSALKAAPLLTAGSAGSRLLTEPGEVVKDSLIAAGGGYILDKATGGLGKIAARRGEARAIPGQQQAVSEANALQAQEFNALKQNVKGANKARLDQHQAELTKHEARLSQEQNDYAQRKLQRDAEVIRLKNKAEMDKAQRNANAAQSDADYKAAKQAADLENKQMTEKFKLEQQQYEKALKELPELQKKAQAEHGANVVKNAAEIERNFPKSSKISSDELGVSSFIDEAIDKSGIGGSRQASQLKRILQSLFPEGELIGGRELSKRYKALEDAIQRSEPEVQRVLSEFKQHLGDRLPVLVQDAVAFSKISPLLKRTLDSDIRVVINELGIVGRNIEPAKRNLINNAINNSRSALRGELSPTNFVERVQSGELARDLSNKILTAEDFLFDIAEKDLPGFRKSGLLQNLMDEANRKHSFFVQELTKKLQNKLAKYEIKALESARNVSKKLRQDVKKTYGLAEPVAPPVAPQAPSPVAPPVPPAPLPDIPPVQMPGPVAPPVHFPPPAKPSLMPEPMAPVPQAMPTLPPAQGMAERAGDFLERPLLGGGGQGIVNNPLVKLGGLKYLLGKAALPAEAAYLGMKGLTSPTAMGEAARMTFKQGGIQAITQWAQRYPSFHDGILESPQDRRSLTKEVENASDIPIEQKAVIQSKINRGKPLQERL